MKHCRRCDTTKPRSAFHADPRLADGLRTYCNDCGVTAQREWRRANKGQWAAYQQAWRERNAGSVAGYHKDSGYAAQGKWRTANRDKVCEIHARRRAARPSWADDALIKDIYTYARIMRAHGVACEVDHIVPLNGRNVRGFHSHDNLQVLSTTANRQKGNSHGTP